MPAWKGRPPLKVVVAVGVALAVAAAIVVGSVYLTAPRATRVGVGDVAPDFTLPNLIGRATPFQLSSLRPGPTLVVFFDTHWPGSDAYLRYLDRMVYRRYLRRGLRMVGVALDSDLASAQRLVVASELTFNVLSDPEGATVTPLYDRPRDPEAYLLDAQGRVEAVFTERIDWANPVTRQQLERHLSPPPVIR